MAAQMTKQEASVGAIVCRTDLDQPCGHTKHSRPHFTRKRETRSESLEIPTNVVLPQRGTAEPFLRLHNLYPSPRCTRQAALPRPGRRVVSQHSYPLTRFSSVPLDPMEHPTSQADLELDYNPPRVQLSDEMFVFQDGRWVNESCRLPSPHCSPPPSCPSRGHPKRLAKEHALQEEVRALRQENRALREENRALRRENRILQVWEEQRVLRGREAGRPASPAPEPAAAPPQDAPAPRSPREGSALQLLREENRTLQQLLEQREACWARAEGRAAPGPHDEPHGPGLLTEQGAGLPAAFDELQGRASPQEDRRALRALREVVSSPAGPGGGVGPADGGQTLELLREVNRALQALREEHRLLQEENRALWENNKLKLQQRLVIDTVTEVTARMEMLIEELYAFVPAKSKEPEKPGRV